MAAGDAGAGEALVSARSQVRIALITIFLVALVDVLVVVQAHRWYERSRSQAGLRVLRRLGWFLLALEGAHAALLSAKLNFLLVKFVAVAGDEQLLRPSAYDQRIELGSRFLWIIIAAHVQSGFTWRGYRITQKRWMKSLLVIFWFALGSVCAAQLVLYSVALSAHRASMFTPASRVITCIFSWIGFSQNTTLAWLFYKEFIFDRRSSRLPGQDGDPITDFAIQALAHQAALAILSLGSSLAASQFTLYGAYINGTLTHLYSPVCLLSALTALLSHDDLRQRVRPRAGRDGDELRTSGSRKAPPDRLTRHKSADDPSFWRADMSRVSQMAESAPVSQIKVERVVSRRVDDAGTDERQASELDYFNFDLTALDRAKPAVTRPSVRFGAQSENGLLQMPELARVA